MNLCAVFRMRKSKLKYRLTRQDGSQVLLNAQQIYQSEVRCNWQRQQGLPWQFVYVNVELNLGSPKKPKWISVRLLFVRALNEDGNGGAKDWALFLTSDDTLSADKILEIYALRWAIEVYFKEAKQHLGYLKQQTRSFASHLASAHLSAVRYLMLVHISQQQGENLGEVRTKMQKQLLELRCKNNYICSVMHSSSGTCFEASCILYSSSRSIS